MARDYLKRLIKVLVRQGRKAEAIYKLMEDYDYSKIDAETYVREREKEVERELNND